MASRPKGFGLTAECDRKKAAKFDPERANEAVAWIQAILEKKGEHSELIAKLKPVTAMDDIQSMFKDGVILCEAINILAPGSVKKINKNNMAFKQMENIGNFLGGCEGVGCLKSDIFQTVDLFEASNIPAVVDGIHALGRKTQDTCKQLGIPTLGPAEAEAHKREFTEEQLRSGQNVIGLQMGSNKGASQAGQNFGKTRAIID